MFRARLLLTIAFLAGCSAAQQDSLPKIDASAVWQVSPQFLANAHAACDKSSPMATANA